MFASNGTMLWWAGLLTGITGIVGLALTTLGDSAEVATFAATGGSRDNVGARHTSDLEGAAGELESRVLVEFDSGQSDKVTTPQGSDQDPTGEHEPRVLVEFDSGHQIDLSGAFAADGSCNGAVLVELVDSHVADGLLTVGEADRLQDRLLNSDTNGACGLELVAAADLPEFDSHGVLPEGAVIEAITVFGHSWYMGADNSTVGTTRDWKIDFWPSSAELSGVDREIFEQLQGMQLDPDSYPALEPGTWYGEATAALAGGGVNPSRAASGAPG